MQTPNKNKRRKKNDNQTNKQRTKTPRTSKRNQEFNMMDYAAEQVFWEMATWLLFALGISILYKMFWKPAPKTIVQPMPKKIVRVITR